jgi:hypothetical protein
VLWDLKCPMPRRRIRNAAHSTSARARPRDVQSERRASSTRSRPPKRLGLGRAAPPRLTGSPSPPASSPPGHRAYRPTRHRSPAGYAGIQEVAGPMITIRLCHPAPSATRKERSIS